MIQGSFREKSDIKTSKILVKPVKSLGQNYLIDENIARKIVNSLGLSKSDVVVEIGPGQGAITKYIIDKVESFIAIEIDDRVVNDLKDKFSINNFELIKKDFLDINISNIEKKYGKKIRLVGNIPYYLTSPILFKAFDERNSISDITFMMQQEVAQRIAAKSGTKNYGILSVFSQFYGVPKILFKVSNNCFYPKPKVTSAVIKIDFYDKLPYDVDEELFRLIVRTTFGKRRKTIRNGLKFLPFDESINKKIISNINFNFDDRPENLNVSSFVHLTNEIYKMLKNA